MRASKNFPLLQSLCVNACPRPQTILFTSVTLLVDDEDGKGSGVTNAKSNQNVDQDEKQGTKSHISRGE